MSGNQSNLYAALAKITSTNTVNLPAAFSEQQRLLYILKRLAGELQPYISSTIAGSGGREKTEEEIAQQVNKELGLNWNPAAQGIESDYGDELTSSPPGALKPLKFTTGSPLPYTLDTDSNPPSSQRQRDLPSDPAETFEEKEMRESLDLPELIHPKIEMAGEVLDPGLRSSQQEGQGYPDEEEKDEEEY